jgi:hypothetical protein
MPAAIATRILKPLVLTEARYVVLTSLHVFGSIFTQVARGLPTTAAQGIFDGSWSAAAGQTSGGGYGAAGTVYTQFLAPNGNSACGTPCR